TTRTTRRCSCTTASRSRSSSRRERSSTVDHADLCGQDVPGGPMIKSLRMGFWLVVCALCLSFATSARAQSPEAPNPNGGSLHFTGGTDDASAYVFRGFVQEQDPKLTVFPYGDVAVALTSGDGLIRSTVVNVGVWNSLNTGASGAKGPSGHTHYEED